jgi:hypothetical protein
MNKNLAEPKAATKHPPRTTTATGRGRGASKIWDFDHHYPMSPFLTKTKAEFATIARQFNTGHHSTTVHS